MLAIIIVGILAIFFVNRDKGESLKEIPEEELESIIEERKWQEDEQIKEAIETGNPTLVVLSEEASAGENVIVFAALVNNPGILGMDLSISYDESRLSLNAVREGDAFGDSISMSHTKGLKSGAHFMWSGEQVKQDQIHDGIILGMEFNVKDEAAVGKTPIVLIKDVDGIYDNDLSIVDLTVKNGYITITKQ